MWIAVHCKPQAELRVCRGIEAAGHAAWHPVERVRIHHRWDRSIVIKPLFQRYVFADIDPALMVTQIFEIDGITDVLRTAGRPVGIPGDVVDALRAAEAAGAFDRTRPPAIGILAGDTVRIVDGPFDGLLAKVRSAKSRKRIEVLVDFVHRLTLPVDKLAKVGP